MSYRILLTLFQRIYIFRLTAFACVLLSAAANAYESCYDAWFCLVKQDTENGFAVSNQTRFPVVVHLTGSWRQSGEQSQQLDLSIPLSANQSFQYQFEMPIEEVWPSFHYKVTWVGGELFAEHHDNYQYQLPYASHQSFRIVQGFNGGFSHRGASRYAVDFAMPVGTPVHAAREGVVIDSESRHWRGGSSRRYAKYANYIIVLHDDGTTGEYYHLRQNGVLVKRGQRVSKGQHIGYSGNTGFSSLPHLHFAVYRALERGKYQSIRFKFQE